MPLRLTFNTLKHLFACCLLLTGFALPLSAWAVDTDGDGFSDLLEFENFNTGWSIGTGGVYVMSGGARVQFSCQGTFCTVTGFKTTGNKLVYDIQRTHDALGGVSLAVDGNNVTPTCVAVTSRISHCELALSAAAHQLKWTGAQGCLISCSSATYPVSITNVAVAPADNCPTVSNANQLDSNGDDVGNACAIDTDGDGIDNAIDTDDDNDGVADTGDAFPLNATETLDTDNDGAGNNADTDDDNDGLLDVNDNCPVNSNTDQLNTDGDTQGDACDTDDDNDGVFDFNDNCPINSNTDQLNTDGDAQGNLCDTDDDNDGDLDSDEIAQGTDPLNPVENSGAHTTVSFENGLPAGWTKPAAANVGWIPDATQASHLTKSLRTAPTGNSQKAQVQMTAFFGGTAFSFDLKVSSESNNDNFRLYVDGAGQVIKSGELGWQTIVVPITGGVHTVKFEYLKNGSIASGSDAIWIDKFIYIDGDVDNDGQDNTVDLDDDNDGAPDYLDPEPLNPANSSVWPLNNHYQGSAVNESQTVQ